MAVYHAALSAIQAGNKQSSAAFFNNQTQIKTMSLPDAPGRSPSSGSSTDMPPGTVLSSYRIIRKLGWGGMGKVYLARDSHLDRDVALKVVNTRLAGDPAMVARFRREATILASLKHPNIAVIYRLEECEYGWFHVMEYVEGQTLEGVLHNGPLPLEHALQVCLQIARALDYAHNHPRPVIHRDLKPANVMYAAPNHVKLLDFGLAVWHCVRSGADDAETKNTGSADDPDGIATPGSSAPWGTPGYMSPEQSRGQPIDWRTDIWAFGCVFYECLTGSPAFPGRLKRERLSAALHETPDWSRLPCALPDELNEMLRQCLVREPECRLHDMGKIVAALDEACDRRRVPSPAESASVPSNLPKPLSSFVGREREIRTVRESLGRVRLVTLTGSGGCGKTRLAIRVASEMRDHAGEADSTDAPSPRRWNGIWFTDLAHLVDGEHLPGTCSTPFASTAEASRRSRPTPLPRWWSCFNRNTHC